MKSTRKLVLAGLGLLPLLLAACAAVTNYRAARARYRRGAARP